MEALNLERESWCPRFFCLGGGRAFSALWLWMGFREMERFLLESGLMIVGYWPRVFTGQVQGLGQLCHDKGAGKEIYVVGGTLREAHRVPPSVCQTAHVVDSMDYSLSIATIIVVTLSLTVNRHELFKIIEPRSAEMYFYVLEK